MQVVEMIVRTPYEQTPMQGPADSEQCAEKPENLQIHLTSFASHSQIHLKSPFH